MDFSVLQLILLLILSIGIAILVVFLLNKLSARHSKENPVSQDKQDEQSEQQNAFGTEEQNSPLDFTSANVSNTKSLSGKNEEEKKWPQEALDLLNDESISPKISFDGEIVPLAENYIAASLPANYYDSDRFNNKNEAYFENGVLYDVSPRNEGISLDEDREVAYNARYVILDGARYDLYSPEDIQKIELPDFSKYNGDCRYLTRNFVYIMKIRAKCEYVPLLAVPMVYKAVSLMLKTDMGWNKEDYMSLVYHLLRVGEIKHSDYLLEQLNSILPFMANDLYFKKCHLKQQLQLAIQLKTDLIEIQELGTTCSECTKYQGRVYSISGSDSRFPKMPEHFYEYAGIHKGCHHSFFAFTYFEGCTINKYGYDEHGNSILVPVDAIEYSNRPFVDDRTITEKKEYEEYMQKKQEELMYLNEEREKCIKYSQRRSEYEWICANIPRLAPKSLSGYTRMKRSQSANYLKLKDYAAHRGMILDDDL